MNTELISKVLSLYEATLEIPIEKPAREFLLCPVGLIGSGKTTVVKRLGKELSLLRLSTDDVRKVIYDLPAKATLEEFNEVMTTLFNKYLELGYSIAMDADCASLLTQQIINERQKQYNLGVIWVHIKASEEIILSRLKERGGSWLFKTEEQAVNNYLQRKVLHENLTMPFVYTFDTSSPDLDSQITEAVQLIRTEVSK